MFFTSLTDARTKEWQVRTIRFQGNITFNSRELLSLTYLQPKKVFKKVRFSEWRLRSDVDVIKKYYRSQGFLENKVNVSSMKRDTAEMKVDIMFDITEGPRTAVNKVRIEMTDSLFDSALYKKLSMKNGKYLMSGLINADIQYLKDHLSAKGYLDSKVSIAVPIDTAHYQAAVLYKVNEGPLIRVNKISICGLEKIKERYVKRELKFRENDILTTDRIRRSEQNLYRTNLLNSVLIEHSADSTECSGKSTVAVSVTETDFFKLQTGIGYSYYGETYKYYKGIRAHLESSYSNLFGLGHQISCDLKGSFLQQYGGITYSTPWFFSIPLQFASTFYVDRLTKTNIDSTMVRGIELSFNYQANKNLEYVYRVKWDDMVWFSPIESGKTPQNTTKIIGADIVYDTRNDIVDPSNGLYNLATIDVAGLSDKKSNRYIKITDDFHLFKKWRSFTFGTGLQLGLIYAYDKKNQAIPPLEQFGLGGTKILRGYPLDSLHIDTGKVFKAAANLIEIRFPIIWWFSGAMFLDVGNVFELPFEHSVFRHLKWCAGPGLRVKTPLAVLRMDVGFRLEDPGKFEIQFDIGQPF